MKKIICFFLIIFFACASRQETLLKNYKNDRKKTNAIAQIKDELVITLTKKSKTKTNWIYESRINKMDDTITKYATLESINSLNLDFPYQGENHGRIMVRKRGENNLEVIFSINRGQLLCHSFGDPCDMLVRFDNNLPITFVGGGSTDPGDTTIMFIYEHEKFIAHLATAKNIKISKIIYGNGTQILEFKTPTPLE